ncbi:methanobactin biosynthesis protein MbnC [Chitinivorax sp. B]|uniref:methanobactin biosynthesis protein MbnC n=1 Tax=Chitinivorax sp. B TaxID=2502235 RepID=UPI00148500D7|nr:methanobactin biosynthesis protein MbnC [Chitinivorax sp. B]
MIYPSITALPDRAITDRELLDYLIDPSARTMFPVDSRAFVRVDISLRHYWHTLFDVCPELLDIADPEGMEIFEPFLAWAATHSLSMGWHYYLWVARWLAQSPYVTQLDGTLNERLMAAAAARWAVLDRSANAGIVLGRTGSDSWIVAWKPNTLTDGRRVERLDVCGAVPAPVFDYGVFFAATDELDEFPGWQPIPC